MAETEKPKKPGKLKRMIELNPTIAEAVDGGRLDLLLREGLVEQSQLQVARRALANPKQAVTVNTTRDIVAETLSVLLDIITHDPAIFTKVRGALPRHKIHEGNMTGLVAAAAKSTAKDLAKKTLSQHFGVLGQHIADAAFKTDKKKKP